ncbi:membrane dipeptidase, partial [Acinetobacter baumannii]
FDGALISHEIEDVRGLHLLIEAMQKRHYSNEIIEKICFSNWLTVLNRILSK